MFVLAKIWKLGGTDDYFCSVVVVTSSSQLPPAHGVKFCRWSTRGLACSQVEQAKSLAAVCVVCAGLGDCSYVKHDQEKFLFKIWWVNNPGIEIFHFSPHLKLYYLTYSVKLIPLALSSTRHGQPEGMVVQKGDSHAEWGWSWAFHFYKGFGYSPSMNSGHFVYFCPWKWKCSTEVNLLAFMLASEWKDFGLTLLLFFPTICQHGKAKEYTHWLHHIVLLSTP
jgi:hypothetical protein